MTARSLPFLLGLPLILGLTFLAGACGAPHLATVRHAEANLEGRDVAALACLGEPLAQLPTDIPGTTVWRFSSAQPRHPDDRRVRDPDQPAEAHDRACIADATVADGRITRVTTDNRAGWGMGSIKNCSNLLAACVADG